MTMAAIPALDEHAERALDHLAALMRGGRTAVLTGAGLSTDSGIPDYRGPGSRARTPMTIQDFLASEAARKRYWAGSHRGWLHFSVTMPNEGHRMLERLERSGAVNAIITQNVDALHQQAGTRHVVELHGGVDRVLCLDCGQQFARQDVAERISSANPWIERQETVTLNPDGDAEVAEIDSFVIPDCTVCGGRLKPDVVFFGEFVPRERFASATAIVDAADVLLIAGSSLTVNSGIRLLEQARRAGKAIGIINRGETKGDARATVRVEGGTSPALAALVSRLSGEKFEAAGRE